MRLTLIFSRWISVALVLLSFSVLAAGQTSKSFHTKFGTHTTKDDGSEVYVISPKIRLTVKYGPKGEACQVEIVQQPWRGPDHLEVDKKVERIISDIIPVSKRGKQIPNGYGIAQNCITSNNDEYERVLITYLNQPCAKTFRVITIWWKGRGCPPGPMALPLLGARQTAPLARAQESGFDRAMMKVLGTWTGTSMCVGDHPACKNEVVVYRFREIANRPREVSLLADKVIDGKRVPMYAVECALADDVQTLTCEFTRGSTHGIWEYKVSDDQMSGTLVILPNRELGRRVKVHRVNEDKVPAAPGLDEYESVSLIHGVSFPSLTNVLAQLTDS